MAREQRHAKIPSKEEANIQKLLGSGMAIRISETDEVRLQNSGAYLGLLLRCLSPASWEVGQQKESLH